MNYRGFWAARPGPARPAPKANHMNFGQTLALCDISIIECIALIQNLNFTNPTPSREISIEEI